MISLRSSTGTTEVAAEKKSKPLHVLPQQLDGFTAKCVMEFASAAPKNTVVVIASTERMTSTVVSLFTDSLDSIKTAFLRALDLNSEGAKRFYSWAQNDTTGDVKRLVERITK